MRFFYIIFSVLFFISCGSSDTIYDQSVGKQVHSFKTHEFKIHYPKNWEIFDSLHVGKNRLRITPSKEIAKGYRYVDYANGRVDTVRRKYRDDVPANKNLQIIEENVDITSTYVYLNKILLFKKSLHEYLDEKIKSAKTNPNLEVDVQKISDEFYIIKLYDKIYNEENGYKFASSRYKIYLKSKANKAFEIIYYAPEYLYHEYVNDANYMLKSFKLL